MLLGKHPIVALRMIPQCRAMWPHPLAVITTQSACLISYQGSSYPYSLPFTPTPFKMNGGPSSTDGQVYLAFDRVGNGGYSIPGADGIYREVGLTQGERFTFRNILDQAAAPESRFALTAYSCNQWGAGCREFAELGKQFYPSDPQYQYVLDRMDGMGTALVNFEKTTALGVAGMFTGGWAFGLAGRLGVGAFGSGAAAGVVGDLTMQAGDNGIFVATGGKYGRLGIDGTELALSGFLGAAPALPAAIRGTAEKLRAMGVQDWNLSVSMPKGLTFYSGPGAIIDLIQMERIGPQMILAKKPVNLDEFARLNVIDSDVGKLRQGEAGAALELQKYLGGRLQRTKPGNPGDFVFESGPHAGKVVDFMLTPDSVKQAASINKYFEKNLSGFKDTLNHHLGKADFIPMDTRFLTDTNKQLLMDVIKNLPAKQQSNIIQFH